MWKYFMILLVIAAIKCSADDPCNDCSRPTGSIQSETEQSSFHFILNRTRITFGIYGDDKEEYFVGTTEESWESARQICKSRNSDLVSIRSKTEQDALATYLTSNGYSKLMFWIGGKRRMEGEDVFYWVSTGLPMEFTYWRRHEPNNARGNENCVHIESKDLNYRWNDHVCETALRFICKKP